MAIAKRAQDTGDASSLSDPNAATFTHLSLTWDVNFDSQQIAATAEYDVKVSTKGAEHLFLDTKGVDIQEILVDGTDVANWTLEDGIAVSYFKEIRSDPSFISVIQTYFCIHFVFATVPNNAMT